MFQNYKTKVKVNRIQHLTDARYFAAMGVDYMGFALDSTDKEAFLLELQKIRAIQEWISGPELFVEVPMVHEWHLEHFMASRISIIELTEPSDWMRLDDFKWFLNNFHSDVSFKHEKVLKYQVWLEQNMPKTWVKDLDKSSLLHVLQYEIEGIQLQGSPHEKLGIKEYLDYDEIFESLEKQ